MALNPVVLKDAYVAINGTAISNNVSSVTVESTFDEVEVTGFGGTYRQFAQGMGDATITLAVFQDYLSSPTSDNVFWNYSQSGGTLFVEVRGSSATVGTANPKYTMFGRVFSFNPIAGAVGDASTTDVSIRNAGTAGLTRGTS